MSIYSAGAGVSVGVKSEYLTEAQARRAIWGRPSARAAIFLAGLIAGGVVFLVVTAASADRVVVKDMGPETYPSDGVLDPVAHASGMYPPEVTPGGITFRWTGRHAALTFPYASHLGRYVHVSMRAAAVWASEHNPALVKLYLNTRPAGQYQIGPQFQEISAELDTWQYPDPYLHRAHVQVDLEATTTHVSDDPRELGVAVDSVKLDAHRSRMQTAMEASTWAIALCAVLFTALRRFDPMWAGVYTAGALLTFAITDLTYMPRAVPPAIEIILVGMAWVAGAWLMQPGRKQTLLPAFGLAVLGTLLVLAGRLTGDWQMDDAYISYRYAWNLVHGHGLVYNPGEVVEGYTNFLWTALAAGSILAGQHPADVALGVNIALAVGLTMLTFYVCTHMSPGSQLKARRAVSISTWVWIWPVLAAALVAIDGAVVTYGARGSGMEAMAFSFLILSGVAVLWSGSGSGPEAGADTGVSPSTVRHRVAGGLVFALASLTRPEGLPASAVFMAIRALQDRRQNRQWLRLLLCALVPYLAVVIPYEVWRISYYSDLLPNTFYTKTGTTAMMIERGWQYVVAFAGEQWLVVGLAVLGLCMRVQRRMTTTGGQGTALAVFTAVYTSYVIWVGGDHFPGWRFLVPVVAPLTLLAVDATRAGLSHLPEHSGARASALIVLGLAYAAYTLSALALQMPDSVLAQLTRLHTAYVHKWGSAGLWLRDNTPADVSAAAKGAGAIAYYSQRRVIDVYGLTEPHIGRLKVDTMGRGKPGHDKKDPAYVLSLKPDYILDEWLNYFQPIKGMIKQQYEYEIHRLPTGPEVAWWHRNGGR